MAKTTTGNAANTAVTTTATKVSVHQLVINVVNAATYIPAPLLAQLQAQINAAVLNATTSKPTVQSTVYNMLLAAGANGISKTQIVNNYMGTTPPPNTAQLISFVTNVNWFLQPSFYTKNNWPVVVTAHPVNGAMFSLKQTPTIIAAYTAYMAAQTPVTPTQG